MSKMTARLRRGVTGGAPLYPLLILFGLNAVDQADQRTFALLAPNIRNHFGLDNGEFLLIVALGLVLGLLMSIPFGFAADRVRRLPIVIGGAIAFGVFSMLTGLATTVWVLVIARAGSSFGTAVSNPTHNSLLADYYDIPVRPKVYSVHRAALAVGACLGPLIAGLLTSWFSWRVPFIVLLVPTLIFVVLALFLREPIRGHFERTAMGADVDTVATEVAAPSYAESWRVCWNIGTLRRIFYALPFLAVAFIGLEIFGSLFYEQVFHLNARDRGYVFALVAPAQLIGLLLTTRIITRLFVRSATLVPRFVAFVGVAVAVAWTAFALSPNLVVAVILNALVTGIVVLIVPPIFARRRSAASATRSRRCGSFPAWSSCRSSAASRTPGESAPGSSSWCRSSSSVPWSSRQPARRSRRTSSASGPRPRRSRKRSTNATRADRSCCSCGVCRSTTTACRCCSTWTSRWTRARSSRSSAPTVRASRPCSGR